VAEWAGAYLYFPFTFHHVQKKRLLELMAPDWEVWAFTDVVVPQTKVMDLSQLGLECTTLNPTSSPH